jgi:tripartite-type tricarboxylate transporter receptor subunit TctC
MVHAQSFSQPIKLIVPFTPGTGMDSIARAVQPKLSEKLGQAIIVQNTPGASGNIGADYVAKSNPDGLTLLMGANTMLIASQMYKNAGYQPVRDFAPVSMAAYGTMMLVANPRSGIKSVKDLINLAKSKPGFVSFGSPGVGTPHHMSMELFKSETNLFMLHVPYKGTAGYTQDLLSGEVMTGFLPVHIAQGFVNSGQLNALAVGSVKRHPVAPLVPTFVELGYKKIDVDLWYAFFLPAKTPQAIVDRYNKELSAIINTPEIKEILGKAGLDAASSSAAELGQIAQKDYVRWGNLIKAKGITFD